MDKIIAIKVKNAGGTYDEIPITALAQNVYWNSNLNLNLKDDIIGEIKQDNNSIPITLQDQIDNLDINKANINNPAFTGNPTINNQAVATQDYVTDQIENHLTKNDLKTSLQSSLEAKNPSSQVDRQYPIIFDTNGKLSVNVPWENTIFSSSIENVWTGTCDTSSVITEKIINLDNTNSFPRQNSLDGDEIIAIYFKEKNAAENPKIVINNIEYSIGFLSQNGNIQLMTNIEPFYKFDSGLKFFVYKANENCWLLSNVDYSIISYLNNKKANLESPHFSGTPTSITPGVNDNSTTIATTEFVKGQIINQLTIGDLQQERTPTNLSSQPPSAMSRKQYPVVFDSMGKLSVNVPWIEPSDIVNNVQQLWTGIVQDESDISNKNIKLNNNNAEGGYGGLVSSTISVAAGETISITKNANILIYFTQGNSAANPKLSLSFHGTNVVKDILYQTGVNSYSKLENNPFYYQWGPGLKIFTYIEYKEGEEDKDGWLISSFDSLIIKNLDERLSTVETDIEIKANKNSPSLTGYPLSTTPSGNIPNQIATAGYVQSECKKILNADENYAFQLKERNSNNNIFAVDWTGKANGVDLNCITTNGIMKTRPETTIIGQYNAITKNYIGIVCSPNVICGDETIVDGTVYVPNSGDYAFVIGNGADNQHRSNLIYIQNYSGGIHINNPSLSVNDLLYSQSRNPFALYLGDKDGNRIGGVAYHVNPEYNEIGVCLQGYRYVNNTNYYNDLRLLVDQNGEFVVRLGSPTAWRKALDLQRSTISVRNIVVSGFLSNTSKDLTFTLPLNRIPYGTPNFTNLSISLRGGDGQPYLYEVSGSNNNQYTQLGFNPVVIWENNKTKRVNGVLRVTAYNQSYTGLLVVIGFQNTLRKANNSTVVAQNNAPYGIQISGDISFT